MNYKILASFEYKKKKYVYYIEKNQPSKMLYGYMKDGIIKELNSAEDIKIMKDAYSQIFISSNTSNHIKVGTTIYHGKLFQEMYDKVSEFIFFYEIKDGKYLMPSDEDSENLFKMFNLNGLYTQSYSNYSYKKGKKKSLGFVLKKILLYGLSTIAAVETAFCIATACKEYESDGETYEISVLTKKNDEYSAKDLETAIDSNPNLGEKEKVLFKEHIPYVIKYKEYADFENLIFKLKTVKIIYTQEHDNYAAGSYFPSTNEIYIYDSTGISDEKIPVLSHEIGHCYSKTHKDSESGIFEATTEILSFEKGYSTNAYCEIIAYQRILYDIIGSLPFAAYNQSGDFKYIHDALMNVLNDENIFNELIFALKNTIVYNRIMGSTTGDYSEKEKEEAKINSYNNKKIIIELLSKYFYASKGYAMESDLTSMLYLKQAGLADDSFGFPVDLKSGEFYFLIREGNFFDSYIEKYKEPVFVAKYKDEEILFKVNDKNEAIIITNSQSGELPDSNVSKTAPPTSEEPQAENLSFGHGIYEGARAVINSENNAETKINIPTKYMEQSTYLKILCEIIGKEPIEEYLKTGDINGIIDILHEIVPETEEKYTMGNAVDLIKFIDMVSNYYIGKEEDSNGQIYFSESEQKELDSIRAEIWRLFYSYYQPVYGHLIMNDSLITFYRFELESRISGYRVWIYDHDTVSVQSTNGSKIVIKSSDNVNVEVSKAYFNSECIDRFPETTVKIVSDKPENPLIVTITDANRKMFFGGGYSFNEANSDGIGDYD